MQDISSVNHGPVGPISRATHPNGVHLNGTTKAADLNGTHSTPSDRVELSRFAQLMTRLREFPDARHQLVQHVREAIQSDDYESPDKIEATIERLVDDLAE